jgi:hypothetical protein
MRYLPSKFSHFNSFVHTCLVSHYYWVRYYICWRGQGSWLQIQRSRIIFPALSYFVVGLVRGPFSLVSTIEELFGRKSRGSDLENQEYDRCSDIQHLLSANLVLTSATSDDRSVGIVRSRTKATRFAVCFVCGICLPQRDSSALHAYFLTELQNKSFINLKQETDFHRWNADLPLIYCLL